MGNEGIKNLLVKFQVNFSPFTDPGWKFTDMKNCILSLVFRKDLIHLDVESSVSRMQTVIELGRVARDRKTLPLKYPLPELVILHNDPKYLSDVLTLQAYVREVTTMDIDLFSYGETFGHFVCPKMKDFCAGIH